MSSEMKKDKEEKVDIPGFADIQTEEPHDVPKAKNKKGGGFESFGLSHKVLQGVKRSYRVPTPIQRKVSYSFFNKI